MIRFNDYGTHNDNGYEALDNIDFYALGRKDDSNRHDHIYIDGISLVPPMYTIYDTL